MKRGTNMLWKRGIGMAAGIYCASPLNEQTVRMLAGEGYRFAARYLVPARYAWKRLAREEAEAISAAGLHILSVFETAAHRAAGGAAAGQADGAAAYREAESIGQPAGSAIYFAVDCQARPEEFDEIEAYLRAAAAQIPGYETGVYGSYAVIEGMADRGACKHYWQTYAWSRGRKSARANIYQYRSQVQSAGITVDLNESCGREGWWILEGKELPMMTADDAKKIIGFLQAAWKAVTTREDREEFHRLANEVRKSAGLPEE
jgi:hypothetical protein